MACCGGKGGSQPISRARWVWGSALLFGYHALWGTALEAAALASPRFRGVAAFHRRYLGDLWRAVRARQGILLEGEAAGEACPRDPAPPAPGGVA
jgi:hypothetical protein